MDSNTKRILTEQYKIYDDIISVISDIMAEIHLGPHPITQLFNKNKKRGQFINKWTGFICVSYPFKTNNYDVQSQICVCKKCGKFDEDTIYNIKQEPITSKVSESILCNCEYH